MNMEIEEKPKNIQVETYADDMNKAIGSIGMNEGGFVKKIIHEQETNDLKKEEFSPESKKNQVFMLLSFLFILAATVSLVFALVIKWKTSTVSVPTHYAPIVFTDGEQFLEIGGMSKDKISKIVNDEAVATEVKSGGLEAIYLTNNKKVIGIKEFLTDIEANVDQNQLAFVEDNFLLGVTNLVNISPVQVEPILDTSSVDMTKDVTSSVDTVKDVLSSTDIVNPAVPETITNVNNKNLFILLKMRSVQDVFTGIHSWEDKMFYDLHGFFGVDITAETKYLLTKDFEDGVVKNKNARILRDKDGKIVLIYVYVNDTSIVLTNSEQTVAEIMTRLAASQVKK